MEKPSITKLKTAFQVAFSPTGGLAAYFGGRNVTALNLRTAETLFSVHPIAHPSFIDFSPDGLRLIVKSTSGRTIVLDAQTGEVFRDFRNQSEGEGAAALFSACGRFVVSASWKGLFSVRDADTSELLHSQMQGRMLNYLSAPRDRRFFVYAASERPLSDLDRFPPQPIYLHQWPITNGDARELPRRWSFIAALEVSPSGRQMAILHGAPAETLDIYDIERSMLISSRSVQFGGTVCSIGWSPDESVVCVAGMERCYVLELPDLRSKYEFPMRYGCHAGFSPSADLLALGSWSTSFIVPTETLETFAAERNKPTTRRAA